MANAAKAEGNFDLARSLLEEVAAASQARGDVRGVASALNGLGDLAASQGDYDAARRYHHQSLDRYRRLNDRWGMARVLSDLAHVDLEALDYDRGESPVHGRAAGVSRPRTSARRRPSAGIAGVVRQLPVARRRGGAARRARAAAIRLRIGTRAKPAERERIDRTLTARGRASATTRLRTPGTRDARRRSIVCWALRSRRGRERAQAYFCGSMSRRTAEIRLAGTPAAARAAGWRLRPAPGRRSRAIVGHVAVQPLNLRAHGLQDFERSHRDVPNLVLGHLADPRQSRVR